MGIMKTDKSKSTILVITIGFLILYLAFSWRWAVFVSLAVGMAGVVSVSLSRIIDRVWMKLSRILSYIIPNVLLGIVFYFFLFPISLISKIFTKDPLMLSNKHKSYFIDIKNEVSKENFEKTW